MNVLPLVLAPTLLSLYSLVCCHFVIFRSKAPELFTPTNAITALQNVETILNGPLGLATLDPKYVICLFVQFA